MRTTLDLNDALLRQAKERAAKNGRSLTSYIEDALRLALARVPKRGKKVKIRVSKHGLGLKKRINLDNTSALLDWLDLQDVRR
jgi:predicted DNA binding CopG/RHH family protein